MPLLKDVRSLFRRKQKPVTMDLSGTQAERLAEAVRGAQALEPVKNETVEPPVPQPRKEIARNRDHEEVMELVRKIGDHLDGQVSHSQQTLQLMEHLPRALDSLPEINRQNAHLLDALHEHFGQARQREEAHNSTLGTIAQTSEHQVELLALVQQKLEAGGRTADRINETLGALQQALTEMTHSNSRAADTLSDMAKIAHRRETDLAATLTRTQRWLTVAVIICGGASAIALIIAAIAMMN